MDAFVEALDNQEDYLFGWSLFLIQNLQRLFSFSMCCWMCCFLLHWICIYRF